MSEVDLHVNSAYHSQFNDQYRIVNKMLVIYLRCLTGDNPREWLQRLHRAEYCYTILNHQPINTPLLKLVCDPDPPFLDKYNSDGSSNTAVDA